MSDSPGPLTPPRHELIDFHGDQRYDALPIDKYDTAVAWIERKAAELLPGDSDAVAPRQETFL